MKPYVNFAWIKASIPIEAVLRHCGTPPAFDEPAGLRGPCPIHGSRSPKSRSFAVKGQAWYCHSCKRGGDVVRLWGLLHHLPDYDAAIELAAVFGITA